MPLVIAATLVAATAALVAQNPRDLVTPGAEPFTARTVASELSDPWEVTWGPDGRLWITERTGYRVTRVNPADGSRRVALTLDGVVQEVVQDGLMGMALHPDLLRGRGRDYVYLAYTYDADPGAGLNRRMRVRRYTYDATTETLGAPHDVIDGLPAGDDHGGGRLVIGPDGMLYLSRGDHGANFLRNYCLANRAQDLPTAAEVTARDWSAYQGKVLRMTLDGGIPADNPMLAGVRSHVYAYGLRNTQGLSFGPGGRLYAAEHGPSSDDEVDVIQAGKNYGWPHVAGFNDDRGYVYARWSAVPTCATLKFDNLNPPPIVPRATEASWSHPDFVAPIATLFTPPAGYDLRTGSTTIGPGSIEVYASDGIPGWRSSLLVTGMRTGRVYRLPLTKDGAGAAGPPLEYFRRANRYRDTAVSPDGRRIYVVTDSAGSTTDAKGQRTDRLEDPGALLEFAFAPR